MKLCLCLFDKKAEMFMQPFFVPSLGVAYRNLADEVNRQNPQDQDVLARHPEDFELYRLGAYDDEKGLILAEERARLVCKVSDLVVQRGEVEAE